MRNLMRTLAIRLPIIQAPMAGGVVTPKMIAEVTKAGGLGSLPLGYLNAAEARKAIQKTAELVKGQFAINVFIPAKETLLDSHKVSQMLAHINHYRAKTGLPEKTDLTPLVEANADELIDIAVAEGVRIVSFTFGTLSERKISQLHQQGVFVMGTATTVNEGLLLNALGCDAVIAQGYEAGGHRGGGFIENQPGGLVGTMALIPQMVDALTIPVIAAGGIMDGRGIAAALTLGASAAQMGTAFLTCKESAASEIHQQMIRDSAEDSTCITSVFTGKFVRGIKNTFVNETEAMFDETAILPYPHQHQATKEFRAKANQLGQTGYASFWSGQGNRLTRSMSVSDFMHKLEEELEVAVSTLSDNMPSRKM